MLSKEEMLDKKFAFAGFFIAEKIETGEIAVDPQLKDILIKLNHSGKIISVASQGPSSASERGRKQRPFVELFLRKKMPVLEYLRVADNLLLLDRWNEKYDEGICARECETPKFPIEFDKDGERWSRLQDRVLRQTGYDLELQSPNITPHVVFMGMHSSARKLHGFISQLEKLLVQDSEQ